ncbi:pentapeptide repeat-containing protein [Leptolyngbya sp. FACHB-36]|uniref:pentapeptide repeat-containing protein n=1 Tax=Leptolyngbya sp. FACHB-36 TaxID=2692808 RepID=UPI0016815559|nr:pentapeptide repeat-containing protein [Leptolyngbya sp. FACHB-36]MBD2021435.1 pentapeptide repeat-containing protein [Leptolyngbya sp. FACHB-36]
MRFANHDLRNRSFRRQDLTQADFSGADIRGCDFSGARLVKANFSGARAGQSRRQIAVLGAAIALTVGLVGYATHQLVYGSLGSGSGDRTWLLVQVLFAVLMLAGAASASRAWRRSTLTKTVTATLAGAILGFFQVGSATNNSPQAALVGAVAGSVVLLAASLRWQGRWQIAISTSGTLMAYGAAFLIGTQAIAFLSVQRFAEGTALGLLSLLYLWLTLVSLTVVVRDAHRAIGTSFRAADLTDAQFDGANLCNTDFSDAMGQPNRQ